MFRFLSLILILFPAILQAQLDRIRLAMTEQEFTSSFPEAKRDYDAEAYWVSKPDTFEVPGNSLWRIYRDTVSNYRFNSASVHGPSAQYPYADSSGVHELRIFLQDFYKELEATFGKPSRLVNIPFDSVGRNSHSSAYSALWTFGGNRYISISLSTDLSTGNFINAPGKYTVIEAASYELTIDITQRSELTNEVFDIGESVSSFYKINRDIQKPTDAGWSKIYRINDSLTSGNAHWKFTFHSDTLLSFSYSAYYGTPYGAKNDANAYLRMKEKTKNIYKDGVRAFEEHDSIYNQMTLGYVMPELQVNYSKTHFYSRWSQPQGTVILNFMEAGGGKNPDIVFMIRADFEVKHH